MSRLAKKPIVIPSGITASISGTTITVKGNGGELSRVFHPLVAIRVEGNAITIEKKGETRLAKALLGTYASHVRNMIAGVSKPFAKQLLIDGVGYKANVAGNKLTLNIGLSHPVELLIPAGVSVTTEKGIINISGIDKEAVGQFAARVRAKKVPEPYKGKGIRYSDEIVRRKQGKKVVG